MVPDKGAINSSNIDEEIRSYIRKKKDENSALKKLLNALESAKKANQGTAKQN